MPPPEFTSRYFPHRAIGYACNPFRALTVDEEAALAVLPAAILDAFEGSADYLQILGEKGRGKSATLLGLAARAEARGLRVAYEYLPEGADRFGTDLAGLDVFVLDEAQRLSRAERGRFLAAAAKETPRAFSMPDFVPPDPLPSAMVRGRFFEPRGLRLVLGSHADFAAEFEQRGLPLRTVRLESLGPEHARAVIERRLEPFALGDRPRATLTPDACTWLAATFGDDLRAMLAFLYEAFQVLTEPLPVNTARLRAMAPLPSFAGEGLGEGAYRRGARMNGW